MRSKRFICILLCIFLLPAFSGCSGSAHNEITKQAGVTIETFDKDYTADTSLSRDETFSYYESSVSTTVTSNTEINGPNTSVDTGFIASDSVSLTSFSEHSYTVSDCEAVMYASSSVNVRQLPDAESERIGHLNKGDKVIVTGVVSNGWMRIRFKNGDYFVNSKYLSENKLSEASSNETTINTVSSFETVSSSVTAVSSIKSDTSVTEASGNDSVYIEEIDPPFGNRHYNALNYNSQKAVWFAYLDIDTMLSDSTFESFTNAVSKAFREVYDMGCNTVYVHVRAFGDAYYFSDYFPFAASYSGTLGVSPDFDPLEIMISEAHKLGLSFHAWVNPMRTAAEKRYEEMSSFYTLKKWYESSSTNGSYIVYDKDTGCYWLSPAYTDVRRLICNGIAEIVTKYDVDGIHIDDYFYPTTSESFDKAAFSVSGYDDLAIWRRETVSRLVSDIYNTVKSCNSSVEFGISPQGNIKNNLNKLYADVELWCSADGYIDYIVPQIYYGFNDKLPFDTTAVEWERMVTNRRIRLICGIAAYKVGTNKEWSSKDILYRQTDYINSLDGYNGCAYYRYGSIFDPSPDVSSLMKDEYDKLVSAVAMIH